jgi:tetratricopeptide (TPR) repeat protein
MSLTRLRDQMVEHFNKSELRDICFDLGINHENIAGDTLNDMARELVMYCQRLRCIEALVKYCARLRPNTSWQLIQPDDLVESQYPSGNNSQLSDKVSQDGIDAYVQKWIDCCITANENGDIKDAFERNWLDIEKTIQLLYFRTGLPQSIQDKASASQLVIITRAIRVYVDDHLSNLVGTNLLIYGYESARSLNDLESAGTLAYSIARLYVFNVKEPNIAEKWVYRFEDLIPHAASEEKYVPYLEVYSLEMLAHVSYLKGNISDAEKRWNIVKEKYEEIGYQKLADKIQGILVELYEEQAAKYTNEGNFFEAENLYKKAAGLLNDMDGSNENEHNKLNKSMASMYLDQANILTKQQKFSQAENCYNKAEEYFQMSQDNTGKARALVQLGYLYETLHRYDQAEKCFIEANNAQWQDTHLLCYARWRLGRLYLSWHIPNPESSWFDKAKGFLSGVGTLQSYAGLAEKHLLKALELTLKYGHDNLLSSIHYGLAFAYWRMDKYAEAIQHTNSALQYAEEEQDFEFAKTIREFRQKIERSRRLSFPF